MKNLKFLFITGGVLLMMPIASKGTFCADKQDILNRYNPDQLSIGTTNDSKQCGNEIKYLDVYNENIPVQLPKGVAMSPEEMEIVMDVIKNDFLVNDDTTIEYEQSDPYVAMNETGNFVICWRDDRNGNSDIYAQLYNSLGNLQGLNFKVNNIAGSSRQRYPSVAMDRAGNFVICWENDRDGTYNIYAQRYDSLGIPQVSNFKVSDYLFLCREFDPSISMDSVGNFVICWKDDRSGNYDIYYQLYNSSGIPQGPNSKVNDDEGSAYQDEPSIAMDGVGNFIICWMDGRNGNWDIYYQLYSSSGVPQGSNFIVNDDTSSRQGYPSVAMDRAGNFVICWQDDRNGNLDIYHQLYNLFGSPQGSNLKVNDDPGLSSQEWPSVAMDPLANRFMIVWTDFKNSADNPEIMAQKYENGSPIGSNFQINESDLFPNTKQQSETGSIACNSDQVVFTWQDARQLKGRDIYAKLTDWKLAVGIKETECSDFHLGQNYPNPFNASTSIKYTLPQKAHVKIDIYNIQGQLVRTLSKGEESSGTHIAVWDGKDNIGKNVSSGVYFFQLKTPTGVQEIRKMLLLR